VSDSAGSRTPRGWLARRRRTKAADDAAAPPESTSASPSPSSELAVPADSAVRATPPPVKPMRLAADANLRAGESPEESLRSVRRAQVGRWWVQLRPWSPGFRAEAHTLSGPPGVWAGELRPTLREATNDAIAMIEQLRHE
jgi:hypothetical protein